MQFFLAFVLFLFLFLFLFFVFCFLFSFLIIQSQAAFVNCLYVARFTIVHSKTQIKFPLLLLLLLLLSLLLLCAKLDQERERAVIKRDMEIHRLPHSSACP